MNDANAEFANTTTAVTATAEPLILLLNVLVVLLVLIDLLASTFAINLKDDFKSEIPPLNVGLE